MSTETVLFLLVLASLALAGWNQYRIFKLKQRWFRLKVALNEEFGMLASHPTSATLAAKRLVTDVIGFMAALEKGVPNYL